MSNIRTGQISTSSEAWTSWTPVVTPQSGSFTTITTSGKYTIIGKTLMGNAKITLTNIGTGTGTIATTIPVATKETFNIIIGYGREDASNGKTLQLRSNSTTSAQIFYYDNTIPMASGLQLLLNFTYEAA